MLNIIVNGQIYPGSWLMFSKSNYFLNLLKVLNKVVAILLAWYSG